MRRVLVICWILIALCFGTVFGQQAVDPFRRYYRLICLIHFTGSGQNGDTVRPEYVPGPSDPPSRQGIIAWNATITDDGTMMIVHMVAVNRNAFAAVFADTRPEVKVFEIGRDAKQTIEAFMQAHKANFKLDSLRVPVQ